MTDRKLCSGCLRDDEENEAEAWCSDCLEEVCRVCSKVHKRLNPPHKIIPLHQVKNLSSSLLKISKDCDVHTDQRIVLYCTQHDTVICYLCMSVTHKNCESIISIDRAANGVHSGSALADLKCRMKHLRKMFHEVLKCQTEDEEVFDRQKDDILQQITTTRQQINHHLDTIEKETRDDLNIQYNTTKQKMNETKRKTQKRHESMETWIKELSSIENISNEVLLFQTIKVMDNKTRIEETNICELSKQNKIEFDPFDIYQSKSMGKISLTENQMHLPELLHYVQQVQHVQVPKISMEEGEGKIRRTYSFPTSVFGSKVEIKDGCFVSGKRLLLAHFNSLHVLVCRYEGNEVHVIKLKYYPYGVAMIDNKQAIVTLNDYGFQILDLTTLTIGSCIEHEGNAYNVVKCSNNQIWTSDNRNRTISQIDIRGNIIRSITTKNNVSNFCIDNNSNIYYIIGSCGDNTVYRITPNGQDSTFCSPFGFSNPHGLDVDDKGNVYLGGGWSDNILRISPDGKNHKIILTKDDGIKHPFGLCYNRERKYLLVLNDDRESVHIYSLP